MSKRFSLTITTRKKISKIEGLRANNTYQLATKGFSGTSSRFNEMVAWDIENYYIAGNKVLCVEFKTPLTSFLMVDIEDVKKEWLEMLGELATEQPGYEMSWEMLPKNDDALVIVRIAKEGALETFTDEEARSALEAVDALFDETEKKKTKTKAKAKKKASSGKKKSTSKKKK